MNVPKLRFGEFKDEWQNSRIDEIFIVKAGGDIAKSSVSECQTEKFKYPIFSNSEKMDGLYGWSFEYRIKEESITVTGRGSLGVAVARYTPYYPIVRLLSLIPKCKFSVKFGAEQINLLDIHVESTGVPQLTAPQLSAYEISYPNFDEQQKIADFLSAVDEKITALAAQKTALTQYKQGMMQRIFAQTLRFKDDNGADYPEWEEMRLGDLLDYEQPTKYLVSSTEYQNDYPTPVLTAGKTFILGYTDEQNGIFTDLPVIIFDDFTTANKFVNFPFKAKSSAMKMLKNDSAKSNLRFIYETMQLLDFATGDEHKRYWISEYQEQFIFVPCLEEQTKIAQFLTELDDKINAVDAQIQSAQQWKQGLLQQMFV